MTRGHSVLNRGYGETQTESIRIEVRKLAKEEYKNGKSTKKATKSEKTKPSEVKSKNYARETNHGYYGATQPVV